MRTLAADMNDLVARATRGRYGRCPETRARVIAAVHRPRRIDTRSERIARRHDAAAQWLAIHDGDRIAAEAEAKRAEARRQDRSLAAARRMRRP